MSKLFTFAVGIVILCLIKGKWLNNQSAILCDFVYVLLKMSDTSDSFT